MTTVTKLILLLTLSVYAYGQCSLGCLACEKTSNVTFKCSVCDLYNHYAVDYKGICTKQIIPNCELGSADRTKNFCLQCEAGFVLDKEIEQCVEVPSINKVDKCVRYLALNHCSECESGFYIKNGICAAISTEIEGCGSYTSDGSKCTRCIAGYVLKSETCQMFDTTENCLVYSMAACNTCKAGFFKEMNYYSTLELDPSKAESIIVENKVEQGTVKPPVPSVCHKQSIDKCVKYMNFKECEQCEDGYYVDRDRHCTKNPYNKIPYCHKYKDKVTCIECEQTHYLASNECVKRNMVDNCKRYKTNSSVCIECDAPYYIDGNNCQMRSFSRRIEFCTQNNLSADECLVCKERFMLTKDNRACLLEIPMCETYNIASNYSIEHFICDTCRPGYYPSEKRDECNRQDVVNCKEYVANSPLCSLCDPGFFYDSSENYCQQYTATGCLTRSPTADKCVTCLVGHYLTAEMECLPYTISNCEKEKPDADECEKCEENHFKSDGNCFKYNLIGCETQKDDKNECSVCISGYYLKNNLCWKNNLSGCKHSSKTANECEKCDSGFYLKDKRCMKHTVPNCDLYKPDANECFADGCADGYLYDNGYCFKAYRPNCDEIDDSTGDCMTDKCADGYYLKSGHCLKQNKPKCVEYSTGNTCIKCETGFYVSSGSCWEQYQEGCIEFKGDNTIECEKCREGYYLKSNSCLPYTISNCETPAAGSDSCAKCLSGYNMDATTGNCYLFDIPYCKVPDPTSSPPECTTCHLGYVKISGKCYLGTSVENCFELDVEPDKCLVCEDGYWSNNGVCTFQDHSTDHGGNCVVFKVNSSDCQVCKSGFHGATCSQVANFTNCLFSDGINDSCSVCKNRYSDTSNCTKIDDAVPLDDNCGGNTTTTATTCSMCKAGYSLVANMTNVNIEFTNCATLKSDKSGCDQCKSGYQLKSDGTCEAGSSSRVCNQTTATNTDELADNTNCAECVDNLAKFLDGTACNDRTVKYDNCIDYNKTSNTEASSLCTKCSEDMTMSQWVNYAHCIDQFDPTNESATYTGDSSNCEALSLTGALDGAITCATCKSGMNNGTTDTCAAPASGAFYYEAVWNSTSKMFINTEAANSTPVEFLHSAVKEDGSVTFVGCKPGYIRTIGASSTTGDGDFTITNKNRTYRDSETGDLLNNPFTILPTTCTDISTLSSFSAIHDPADYDSEVDAFTADMLKNCDLGYDADGFGMLCIKCKRGFNGERIRILKKSAGSGGAIRLLEGTYTAADIINVAVTCEEINTDFEKRYTGASFVDPDLEKILIEDQLQYDSCIDGRHLVVYMEVQSDQLVWSKTFLDDTQRAPSMTCVSSVPDGIFIENCAFYAIKGDQDPLSSTDASYFCASCKPGFKATVASNKVTKCDYIENCDISDPSKNTWMNQCETCMEGSTWQSDATGHFPVWDGCVKTKDPNCWLVKSGGTFDECLICKKGYNVTADLTCLPPNMEKNNCKLMGREATAFTNNHSDVSSLGSDSFSYSRVAAALELRFDGYMTSTIGCRQCNGDYKPFLGTAASEVKACVADFQLFKAAIPNCKIYEPDYSGATHNCKECHLGYSLKDDKSECVENFGLFKNCTLLSPDGKCGGCEEGYHGHEDSSNFYCEPVGNCLVFEPPSTGESACKRCREGYKFVSATSKDCIEIEDSDPCLEYLAPDKCLKCKNGGNPIHYSNAFTDLIIFCTDKPHANDVYGKMAFQYDGSTITFSNLVDESMRMIINADNTNGAWNAEEFSAEICLPKVNVENCLRMGEIGCLECKTGYSLSNPFQCVLGGVANCLKYGPTGVCTQCNQGFYANNEGECTARTLENCLKPDDGGQDCLICDVGYYLDSSNSKRCLLRTNMSCEEYIRESDQCVKCRAGYYLDDSTGKCELSNHPGCLFGSLNDTSCRVCNDGYFLASGTCTPYSFSDCEIYSPIEDKCFVCSKNFYPNATRKCEVRTKLNCDLPDYDADKCISCEAGYYLSNDECTLYSVDGCDVYHPYQDKCQTCLTGLYLEQSTNKCVANPDPNCEEMNPYLNLCLRCIPTAYLDVNTGVCNNYSINCEYYNPYADKCLECPMTHYLSGGECVSYTIKNCLETKRFEDKCASCIPGFYFSEQGVCSAITVQNCDIPSLRENKCVQCSSGFYNDNGVCRQYLVRFCERPDPTEDKCYICKEGYYLNLSGQCEIYTKTGCLGYVPNKDRCASCQGGFYMQDGKCGAYTVMNCRLHDPFDDACLSCQTGYYLSGAECVKFTVKNCDTWSPNSDRCLTCKKEFYLEGFDCKSYTISNCMEYHPKANMCVKCSGDNYFRNGLGLCQLSTIVPNCSVYAEYLDECVACNTGYFLEDKMCVINPQGVFRCKEYLDETHCFRCEVPYYLRDNQCLLSDTLVDGCSLYSHDGICAQCLSGHMLIGNECKPYTNNTCATWSSPENCLTCPTGKVLDTSKSTTTCEDIGIEFCSSANFSADGKHQCTMCNAGYYLFENECKATSSVPNCMEYTSETDCKKCNTGFILSADFKTCSDIANTVGANCAIGSQMADPVCSVCKEGFYFNTKGVCVSCLVDGCAICDVINNRKCRLCKSGYQMTELFYCETINAIEAGSLGEDNNQKVIEVESESEIGMFKGVGRVGFGIISMLFMLLIANMA